MRSLAALVALTVFVAPAAAQDAKSERAARAHYQKGARYFNARQYKKALIEYRAAYALVPRPALLFNIARALHENGDRQEALEHYRRYLAAAPSGEIADEAREFAASLERELAPPPPEPAERAPEPSAPPPAAPEPAAHEPARIEPANPAAVTTTTETVARPARGRLRGGGLAGLTIAGVAYDDWHGGRRVGLAAGGFVSYALLPAFALRLEAAYLQKGTGEDPDYTEHWHTDFLQGALLAQALYWRAHVGLGPYAALRVSADTPFDEELKSLDAGLIAGAGVALPVGPGDVTIDLRYEHGLSSLKNGVDAHNRTFVLAIGYASRGR